MCETKLLPDLLRRQSACKKMQLHFNPIAPRSSSSSNAGGGDGQWLQKLGRRSPSFPEKSDARTETGALRNLICERAGN